MIDGAGPDVNQLFSFFITIIFFLYIIILFYLLIFFCYGYSGREPRRSGIRSGRPEHHRPSRPRRQILLSRPTFGKLQGTNNDNVSLTFLPAPPPNPLLPLWPEKGNKTKTLIDINWELRHAPPTIATAGVAVDCCHNFF